jgi:L-lactate dehydrogenase complex protein LldF
MTVDTKAPYKNRVGEALADERLHTALDRATNRLRGNRAAAMEAIDAERLRSETNAVRQRAVSNLPDLLEELEENLIANGCHVHWARDAAEANQVVCKIAVEHNVRRVVKSKSMTTEEIGLNGALEQAGLHVVETDLGEYIIQLANEPPSHIIAPVIHKRAEDISELFQRELGMEPTDEPAKMCGAARKALRKEFLNADMGISGCNFAIAETGTICVITNEGNGRMTTSMPPVYVAVAGIEKVIPKVEDAFLLWQAAARNATGQPASVYFSMSSGPRREEHPDGPNEMHVVLVDNGRSRVLERGYGDALLCVRCGACLNVCPVYREIGGHSYGATAYSGPIGAVVTPLLSHYLETHEELPFASSLCGACRDVCPAKIDLPRLLLDLRSELTEQATGPSVERLAMSRLSKAMQTPTGYRILTRLARWLMRLFSLRKGGDISKLPPPLNVWTKTRVFPKFAAKSFRQRWSKRQDRRSAGEAK